MVSAVPRNPTGKILKRQPPVHQVPVRVEQAAARPPAAADRWTWLIIACYAQLYLAEGNG
jgi:hypothetical protein